MRNPKVGIRPLDSPRTGDWSASRERLSGTRAPQAIVRKIMLALLFCSPWIKNKRWAQTPRVVEKRNSWPSNVEGSMPKAEIRRFGREAKE
jgi:hypothetical protein